MINKNRLSECTMIRTLTRTIWDRGSTEFPSSTFTDLLVPVMVAQVHMFVTSKATGFTVKVELGAH
jgi:hypothetical protein